jgi:hypothetical protein
MNKIIATLVALSAATVFAAEPAKVEVKPAAPAVTAPAKAEVKKIEEVKKDAKPAKSVPAKDEKAAVPATKPASK